MNPVFKSVMRSLRSIHRGRDPHTFKQIKGVLGLYDEGMDKELKTEQ